MAPLWQALVLLLHCALFINSSPTERNLSDPNEYYRPQIWSILDHLNANPQRGYNYNFGYFVNAQKKTEGVTDIEIEVEAECVNPSECSMKILTCRGYVEYFPESNTFEALPGVDCRPKTRFVEVPKSGVPQKNVEDSSEEVQEVIIRPKKVCTGCVTELNKNATGVDSLLKLALQHVQSERGRIHKIVNVLSVQSQVVAGVRFFVLFEVAPTLCPNSLDVVNPESCPVDQQAQSEICAVQIYQKPTISNDEYVVANNCTVSQEFVPKFAGKTDQDNEIDINNEYRRRCGKRPCKNSQSNGPNFDKIAETGNLEEYGLTQERLAAIEAQIIPSDDSVIKNEMVETTRPVIDKSQMGPVLVPTIQSSPDCGYHTADSPVQHTVQHNLAPANGDDVQHQEQETELVYQQQEPQQVYQQQTYQQQLQEPQQVNQQVYNQQDQQQIHQQQEPQQAYQQQEPQQVYQQLVQQEPQQQEQQVLILTSHVPDIRKRQVADASDESKSSSEETKTTDVTEARTTRQTSPDSSEESRESDEVKATKPTETQRSKRETSDESKSSEEDVGTKVPIVKRQAGAQSSEESKESSEEDVKGTAQPIAREKRQDSGSSEESEEQESAGATIRQKRAVVDDDSSSSSSDSDEDGDKVALKNDDKVKKDKNEDDHKDKSKKNTDDDDKHKSKNIKKVKGNDDGDHKKAIDDESSSSSSSSDEEDKDINRNKRAADDSRPNINDDNKLKINNVENSDDNNDYRNKRAAKKDDSSSSSSSSSSDDDDDDDDDKNVQKSKKAQKSKKSDDKDDNDTSSSSSSSSDDDDDDDDDKLKQKQKNKKSDKDDNDTSSSSSDDDDDNGKSKLKQKNKKSDKDDDNDTSSSSSDDDDDDNTLKQKLQKDKKKNNKDDDKDTSSSSSDDDDDNDNEKLKEKRQKNKKNDKDDNDTSSSSSDDDNNIPKIKKKNDKDDDDDDDTSSSSSDDDDDDDNNIPKTKKKTNKDDDDDSSSSSSDDDNNVHKTKKNGKDDDSSSSSSSSDDDNNNRRKRELGDFAKPNSDEKLLVKKIANFAATSFDDATHKHDVLEVLRVKKIELEGAVYHLTLRVGSQKCTDTCVRDEEKLCKVQMHVSKEQHIKVLKSHCSTSDKDKNRTDKRVRRQIPGGVNPAKDDAVIKELTKSTLLQLDGKSPHQTKYKIVEILDATKQVVSGMLYKIKAKIIVSDCPKNDARDSETCDSLKDASPQVCQIKIWDQPWLPNGRKTDVTCDSDTFTFRSKRSLRNYQLLEQNDFQHFGLFRNFMRDHNKSYRNQEELKFRFRVFRQNLKAAEDLNKNELGTAVYGVTKFADLTTEEFKRYLGYRPELRVENEIEFAQAEIPDVVLPNAFDWRTKGAVTEVKNQQQCGSCWAFSVTGNIEGQYALKYNKLLEFSEQELVDCDTNDEGCNGGLMDNAYRAIEKLGGLETEKDYPYDAEDEKCHFDQSLSKVQLSGAVNISTDENDMAKWLVKNGPISIAINANAMQLYMGGVSHPPKFLCSPDNLDHGVLIVGYGVHKYPLFHKSLPYWIVKNSWGTSWGEQGYYRVFKGDGTCGLNKTPSSGIVV